MIPTTGRDDDAGPDSFRTTVCPHCGSRVPDALFCGACGAHLTHGRGRGAATRTHAHSAFPDEGVLRLAVVSSLFPQLAGASRSAYRVAFGLIVVLLVGLAVAGLTAPVIAVSALAVPLLFLIYLYEIAPREARFAVPTVVIFVAGAALGAAWALLLGPVVSDSLVPGLAASLTNGGVLASAVAVPAIGQLLMLLPVAVAWLRRPDRSEALDGFTAGVASALGLTMAATLTELAPLL
jgi:RsiW-degrading membrane proteinase PrsW (M82 family)